MSVDVEQRIRERAYAIWLEQGCPDGCDAEHWRQAEREIGNEPTSTAAAPVKAPRKSAVKKAKAEPETASPASPAPAAAAPDGATKARKPRARKVVPV